MHVLIATLYAIVIWLSLLAYTIIIGGFWVVIAVTGPFIISAVVIGLLALDLLVARVVRMLRRPRPPDKVSDPIA